MDWGWARQASRSYVTTDGQSASLSLFQYPPGTRDQIFITSDSCWFVDVGLPLWREYWSVVFTIDAGPRQHNHSRVRVPRDSWQYITLPNLTLPNPGGPGPRMYIPPQNKVANLYSQALGSSQSHSATDGQSKLVTKCMLLFYRYWLASKSKCRCNWQSVYVPWCWTPVSGPRFNPRCHEYDLYFRCKIPKVKEGMERPRAGEDVSQSSVELYCWTSGRRVKGIPRE
jgi:hypothetical protein